MAKKKEELDPETLELINWCIEVEGFLVKGGATQQQAQAGHVVSASLHFE